MTGLRRIERARAAVRRHVWRILADRPEGFPEVVVDGVELTGWTVIDTDGSLILAPSDKDGACGTYKGSFGHHVFLAVCDNTGEELAQLLHPGNVTANDTGVNIDLLVRAVAQLPWWRRQKALVRTGWLTATAIACDLRAWLQLLALDGDLAKATPKTLRYRILHVPARLVRGQRRRRLKIPHSWPWAGAIVQAFHRIQALPRPT
ncbi:transposase [Kitasatospora sp. GP82]|uniref:transposase n=1 Tax=Kitasatospora sp. GP82 TaxID=3035089 RepID=UPI002476931D|nr:transposase [Kitasatospora sp. GP82]MDH6129887.1 hypothetical protein [Kitasatospora sp. GP82]